MTVLLYCSYAQHGGAFLSDQSELFPSNCKVGGKLGNVVTSSSLSQIHRGWRIVGVNGQRLGPEEVSKALSAAQKTARYTVTFRLQEDEPKEASDRPEKEPKEILERERLERERLDQERAEQEKEEQERTERERIERLEKERLEKDRLEKERLEKERLEKERLEKEKQREEERQAKARDEERKQEGAKKAARVVAEKSLLSVLREFFRPSKLICISHISYVHLSFQLSWMQIFVWVPGKSLDADGTTVP